MQKYDCFLVQNFLSNTFIHYRWRFNPKYINILNLTYHFCIIFIDIFCDKMNINIMHQNQQAIVGVTF